MANRIVIDLGPLRRSGDFRRLFAGQLMSVIGGQLVMVAIAFQVYALTRSSLQVGAVSMVQVGPLILGALVGGSIGAAVDRRRILMATSLLLSLAGGAMALNAASTHPSLLVIYLLSALAAGVGGVASTVATAAVPALVGSENLVAAYASLQVADQVAMVLAPALSGLLIATVHLAWVYALVALVSALTALVFWQMAALPAAARAAGGSPGSVREAIGYLRGRLVLQGVFLIDINAMVFGLPRALFPALALGAFHGGARALGCLYAAPGVGALVGAVTTGWLARVRRQGWAVVVAVGVWGATIAAFGFVHVLWLGLVLLGAAGWADVISAVLRTTMLQSSVDEPFRHRISSLQIAVVEGGPRLGDLEAGLVANLVSTEFSVVAGGLACLVGAALLAGLWPGFRRDTRPAPRSGERPTEEVP
jgi:MFS family permease